METIDKPKEATKNAFWNKLKTTFSSANISKGWKIVRNVSGSISTIALFATSSACPIILPANVSVWLGAIGLVAGVIAGRAQMNTEKK
jgi:hypothetical protein